MESTSILTVILISLTLGIAYWVFAKLAKEAEKRRLQQKKRFTQKRVDG